MAQPELVEVRAAVENLYQEFESHELRSWTDPCLACCATEEEERALHAAPLRDLPIDVIRPYASNLTTWGDARDFKHLLPRLFEITVDHDFDWPSLEVVYSALRWNDWSAWPASEQQAVRRFLVAKWALCLAKYPGLHPAEDVVCAVGLADDDLSPYLDAWGDADSGAASRHLVDLILHGVNATKRSLTNAFWGGERKEQQLQIIDWLNTESTQRRVLDFAVSLSSGEARDRAELAIQRLPI